MRQVGTDAGHGFWLACSGGQRIEIDVFNGNPGPLHLIGIDGKQLTRSSITAAAIA
jgi:hypothetical protein